MIIIMTGENSIIKEEILNHERKEQCVHSTDNFRTLQSSASIPVPVLPYLDVSQNGGSHKVATFIALHLHAPAVQEQGCALVHSALDELGHTVSGLRGDQGTDICPWLVTWEIRGGKSQYQNQNSAKNGTDCKPFNAISALINCIS